MKKIISILSFSVLLLVFAVLPSYAATTVIYDALPSVSPSTNYPSLGFQATSTKEFGDYIHLGGTNRKLNSVTVTMSDWALFADYAADTRYMSNNVTWIHPITINIYANHLDNDGKPDQLIATKTQDVSIPWRPAEDPVNCPTKTDPGYAYKWQAVPGAPDTNCYNGFAFNASFDLSSLNTTLPDDVIVTVSYNTQSYGTQPIGSNGPYNSLNVAFPDNQVVSEGFDNDVNAVFWDTTYPGYSAGLRNDTGWAPNGTVALKITADSLVVLPTNKDLCKKDGWKTYTDLNGNSFKNQGDCVSYVQSNEKALGNKNK
jgi:hypothetical protein